MTLHAAIFSFKEQCLKLKLELHLFLRTVSGKIKSFGVDEASN